MQHEHDSDHLENHCVWTPLISYSALKYSSGCVCFYKRSSIESSQPLLIDDCATQMLSICHNSTSTATPAWSGTACTIKIILLISSPSSEDRTNIHFIAKGNACHLVWRTKFNLKCALLDWDIVLAMVVKGCLVNLGSLVIASTDTLVKRPLGVMSVVMCVQQPGAIWRCRSYSEKRVNKFERIY